MIAVEFLGNLVDVLSGNLDLFCILRVKINNDIVTQEPKFYDELYTDEEIKRYVNKLGENILKQINQNLAANK